MDMLINLLISLVLTALAYMAFPVIRLIIMVNLKKHMQKELHCGTPLY